MNFDLTISRRAHRRIAAAAIVHLALAFVAFLMLVTYNTWSPGTMGTDPGQDHFESALAVTWAVWGALPALVLWCIAFVAPLKVMDS